MLKFLCGNQSLQKIKRNFLAREQQNTALPGEVTYILEITTWEPVMFFQSVGTYKVPQNPTGGKSQPRHPKKCDVKNVKLQETIVQL